MAITVTDLVELDVNQPLVKEDGTPSIYFEDLWYQLSVSISQINIVLEDHETRIAALEGP